MHVHIFAAQGQCLQLLITSEKIVLHYVCRVKDREATLTQNVVGILGGRKVEMTRAIC